MKSLDQIQQDLEAEGFECIGGEGIGEHFKMRKFKRLEGLCAFSIIRVTIFNQDLDEEPDLEEGEEEEEVLPHIPEGFLPVRGAKLEPFQLEGDEEKVFVLLSLVSKYPDDIVRLIDRGLMEVPLWLQKEILERRG